MKMARLADEISKDLFLRLSKQKNLITITDFLHEDIDKLARITKLSFKDILQLRNRILPKFSSVCVSGLDAYSVLVTNSAILSTGIESLDRILNGGLRTGSVFEICGQSGTGKTQLCLTIAMNVSHQLNQTVYYIDSKNDFSASRIQTVLLNKGYSELACRNILKQIVVVKIKNITQLVLLLNNLRRTLSHRNTSLCRLIIIDSLPVLYFPFIGGANAEGLGFLNSVMTIVKSIASEFFITFCIVNIATLCTETDNSIPEDCVELQSGTEEIRPMLGKYWLHTPSTRCFIKKCVGNLTTRTIKIVQSTYFKTGSLCNVEVGEFGIV